VEISPANPYFFVLSSSYVIKEKGENFMIWTMHHGMSLYLRWIIDKRVGCVEGEYVCWREV